MNKRSSEFQPGAISALQHIDNVDRLVYNLLNSDRAMPEAIANVGPRRPHALVTPHPHAAAGVPLRAMVDGE